MMLDKQIQTIFLLKMDYRAMETTCSINSAFGPVSANEHTVQLWFKKFREGDESLEDEERSCWPLEVDSDQLSASHWSWSSYSYTRSCQKKKNVDHSTVIQHFKQIGKVRKLGQVGTSWADCKSKKFIFSYSTPQQAISRSDYDMWQKVDFVH